MIFFPTKFLQKFSIFFSNQKYYQSFNVSRINAFHYCFLNFWGLLILWNSWGNRENFSSLSLFLSLSRHLLLSYSQSLPYEILLKHKDFYCSLRRPSFYFPPILNIFLCHLSPHLTLFMNNSHDVSFITFWYRRNNLYISTFLILDVKWKNVSSIVPSIQLQEKETVFLFLSWNFNEQTSLNGIKKEWKQNKWKILIKSDSRFHLENRFRFFFVLTQRQRQGATKEGI